MAIRTGSISPGGGGEDFESVQVDTDYTAPVPDGPGLCIYCDVVLNSLTVTLPETAGDKIYVIKQIDTGGGGSGNQVRVRVDNGTIDGAAIYTITQDYQAILVQCRATGIYFIDSDYDPSGSGATPNLQLVAAAGRDAGTYIRATQYQASGVQTIITSGAHVAALGTSLYLIDLNAAAGDITITFPTGAAAVGALFAFQIIALSPGNNYRVRLLQTNGGGVTMSQLNETALLQCFAAVGLNPYKRIAPAVRTSAQLYALTVPAAATFNIPHTLRSQPDSVNIMPANAAAQGVLAGGYYATADGTNIIVTPIVPVGAPVVGCQFWYQAFATF